MKSSRMTELCDNTPTPGITQFLRTSALRRRLAVPESCEPCRGTCSLEKAEEGGDPSYFVNSTNGATSPWAIAKPKSARQIFRRASEESISA